MTKPLALYIGLRYTRAKRRNHFISFIALTSMLGIALGVAVLITVLSVMNGFDDQIRSRFFALVPQVTIMTGNNATDQWPNLQSKIAQIPGVVASAPYVSGQGLLLQDSNMQAVNVMGIDPSQEVNVLQLARKMVQGKLTSLQPGEFNIVIGRRMAERLGLNIGDKINVLTPEVSNTPLGMMPRFKSFTVSGIFHANDGFGFDLGAVYINLVDAQKLFGGGQPINGLNVKITDLYQAEAVSQVIQQQLPFGYLVTNWTKQYGTFFHAIAMEKTILFVILFLIVGVAVFNLVSTLVMVVNDKRADIAILRTLGATPTTIMSTFIIQGGVIGLVGTILGLCGGLALAANVTHIVNGLQHLLNVHFISSSVYFINYLPSKISVSDVIEVCLIAFGLSLIATLYPAWIAFRTEPAEALRYE